MNRYYIIPFICLLIMACNQESSKAEREYIKNLEEKNKILEQELLELKRKSTDVSQESKQEPKSPKAYFSIGSTEDEVLEVMGDPTNYTDLGSQNKRFYYGSSSIFFQKGKVISYDNFDGNLKVKIVK
jgi:hypothetical protein